MANNRVSTDSGSSVHYDAFLHARIHKGEEVIHIDRRYDFEIPPKQFYMCLFTNDGTEL